MPKPNNKATTWNGKPLTFVVGQCSPDLAIAHNNLYEKHHLYENGGRQHDAHRTITEKAKSTGRETGPSFPMKQTGVF